MYLLSVSPVFAPELFPQNIYTDKPPVSPRAPSVPLCPWWESLWEQDVRGMFSSQLQAMRTGSRHGTGVPSSRCAHWQDQTGWHPGWDVTGPQWVLWPGPTDEACAGCWSPLQPLSPCFLLLFSLLTSQRVGFGFFFLINCFTFHYSRNTYSWIFVLLSTNWRTTHTLVLAPAPVPSL